MIRRGASVAEAAGRRPSRDAIDMHGWLHTAHRRPSPHVDARPPGVRVSLVVIHAISLPPGRFGGDTIERLFNGTLDPTSHPSLASLEGLRVSAHFLIRRGGALVQFVSVHDRAWHAGRSRHRGRPGCNDYAVGIELEGDGRRRFTRAQYRCLSRLIQALARRLPLRDIAGHSHIAPRRKRDPGPLFNWRALFESTQARGLRWPLTAAGRVIARRI
jgi:AmpD protein